MTAETDIEIPPPRRPHAWPVVRKILKMGGIAAASLLGLVVLTLVCVRLYFSDERLRGLAEQAARERLKTEVTIGHLEISLLSGLEIHDVRVSPPRGFTRDPIAFHRLAVHWSAVKLLRLHVVIPEIAFEGVRLALEENDQGQNLQTILAAVKGPSEPQPEKPPEVTAKKPLVVEQPSIPVRIEVQHLSFTVDSVEVVKPTQKVSIDRIGMQGHLEAEGETMSLSLWLGLGDRDPAGAASHFQAQGGKPFSQVDSEQRLGITLESSGLGDLRLGVKLAAETQLSGDRTLPLLRTAADLQSHLDLLTQRFELATCDVRVGEGTALSTTAVGENILTAPMVHIDALSFRSDLTELAPLITAFSPEVAVSGRVSATAEPFDVIADPVHMDSMVATAHIALDDVGVKLKNSTVTGLTMKSTLSAAAGQATVHVDMKLGKYSAGTQDAANLAGIVDITTPLSPWVGGPTTGTVGTRGRVGVRHYGYPGATYDNLDIDFDVQAPIALIKKQTDAAPLVTTLRVKIREIAMNGYGVRDLHVKIGMRAKDLAFRQMIADVDSTMGNISFPYGNAAITLDRALFKMGVTRNGDRYGIDGFDFRSPDTFQMQMHGVIDQAVGPAPIFDKFVITIGPLDLARTLSLLPAAQRPQGTVSGSMGLALKLQGRIPYKELIPKTKLPKRATDEAQADLSKLMVAYNEFLQSWQNDFERGLGFSAAFDFSLKEASFTDDKNDLRGVNMKFAFALDEHSPSMTWSLDVSEVVKPVVARDLSTGFDFSIADGLLKAAYRFKAAAFEREDLTHPLENAGLDVQLSYRPGGDLLLDRFLVEAPDRGIKLDASGVISKPLQFALSRGWERPGLPGLDVTLRCAVGVDAGDQKPITKNGPELGGKVGLSGTLRAVDGVIGVDGVLDTEHLTYLSGRTLVEDMSGALPFDVQVTFDPRTDATVLRRGVEIGGGVVALLTSGEDIRRRPARPTYYDRIRPYRQRPGISARSIRSGDYEIFDFLLEGRLTQGMLLADALSMHILGGDVTGNMALQLGRDATVRADMAFKVSNIDASYFKALNLDPGPDSELSADMQLGLLLGSKNRDLTMNMNITKIGTETFDRFLQLLDPKSTDEKMQKNRKYVRYVRIDNVAVWMRYESLNMDLDVTTFLRIPGTSIGFPRIDRELLRRYSLTDRLDVIFNPINAKYLAPLLGWNRAG